MIVRRSEGGEARVCLSVGSGEEMVASDGLSE